MKNLKELHLVREDVRSERPLRNKVKMGLSHPSLWAMYFLQIGGDDGQVSMGKKIWDTKDCPHQGFVFVGNQ